MAPHAGRFMTRLRELLGTERGASAPLLVIGAVIVFGIVSVAFGSGLQAGMKTMQDQKINSAIAANANKLATKEANRGYLVARSLPASSNVTMKVSGKTVTGVRQVTVDTDAQTAEITIRFGKYVAGEWKTVSSCAATPENCITSRDLATATLAQSFPEVTTATGVNQAVNIPATGATESVYVAAGVGIDTTIAASGSSLHAWGANAAGESGRTAGTPSHAAAGVTIPTGVSFTDLDMGDRTSYGLDTEGWLWSWGDNSKGQTGQGATGIRKVSSTIKFTQVDAGGTHACALATTGDIYCWGDAAGRWKNTTASTTPTRIYAAGDAAGAQKFTHISVGRTHQLAVDRAGNVWSWGANNVGQLGNGVANSTIVAAPTRIASPLFTNAVETVTAGADTSYAVDAFGRAFAWGAGTNGALGEGATNTRTSPIRIGGEMQFASIHAGNQRAYAITRTGALYGWGANGGLLGDGDTTATPTLTPKKIAAGFSFIDVAIPLHPAGGVTVAIDSTHRVWQWGKGTNFGDGNDELQNQPTATQYRYRLDGGRTVASIDAGADHAVAVGADGTAWAWGQNGTKQLGNAAGRASELHPTQVKATYSNDLYDIAVGRDHIIALGKLGTIVGAGSNWNGQLAAGGNGNQVSPVVPTTKQFSKVSAGVLHTLAIERSTGKVFGWGHNLERQTAPSSSANSITTATEVTGLPDDSPIIDVAAGAEESIALDRDGRVWAWGAANFGQRGNGVTSSAPNRPTLVNLDRKIVAIAAGYQFSLAIDEAGNVWTWGRNHQGQLGVNSTAPYIAIPVQITLPEAAADIAAGVSDGYAVTVTGKVYSWGEAIGTGTNVFEPTPKHLTSITEKAVQVTAGGQNVLVITENLSVWGWGASVGGSLGVTSPRPTPVRLRNSGDVIAAGTNTANSVLVLNNGATIIAGADANGQVGNGPDVHAGPWIGYTHFGTALAGNAPAYAKSGTTWKPVKFESLAAGTGFTTAVDQNGHWWAWGGATTALNGAGRAAQQLLPVMVASSEKVTKVAAGTTHHLALNQDGTVHGVGSSTNGELGRNNVTLPVPTRLPIADHVAEISAGPANTATLNPAGSRVWTLGSNTNSQRGTTSTTPWQPSLVTSTSGLKDIASTATSTILLRADGTVGWWGSPPWGTATSPYDGATFLSVDGSGAAAAGVIANALNGARTYGVIDATIRTQTPARFTDVEVGGQHAIALDSQGVIWTYGANVPGPVNRGTNAVPTTTPLALDGPGGVNTRRLVPETNTIRDLTYWKFATVNAGAKGEVQVNVKADGVPVTAVAITCADGSIRRSEETIPSSGDYRYANIDLAGMAGCASPTLTAVLDGKPATVNQVEILMVPLVYAAGTVR